MVLYYYCHFTSEEIELLRSQVTQSKENSLLCFSPLLSILWYSKDKEQDKLKGQHRRDRELPDSYHSVT